MEPHFAGVDGESYRSLKFSLRAFVLSTGFMFGFEFGITGGLLLNPTFLEKFFPNAYKNTIPNSLTLVGDFDVNLYRSSLYLAAFISSYTINIFRIHTYTKMRIGGCLMFIGAEIGICFALAQNIMLMTCGRILFGVGIGIVIQVVATHASETRYRRQVVTLFPRAISCGIVIGNGWFNYAIRTMARFTKATARDFAYASSFSLMMVLLLTSGNTLSISERIKRLFNDSSKDVENCVKTEGPATDEAERSLIQEVETSPNSTIFRRKYIPSLVVAICISIFQQFTGVYALMIYAPVLFKAVGLDEGTSIFCSIVMYFANCFVMCDRSVATITRKFGRRSLFIQGGTTMLLCEIIITFISRVHENLGVMPGWNAFLLVVAMIAYAGGFAWSWGPLGWLVPSEILPLKIQSIGYSLCVSMNMVSMFFVSQFFTMGLSEMRFGMHLVILSLVFFMTIFVYVLLPETKGVKVEDVSKF